MNLFNAAFFSNFFCVSKQLAAYSLSPKFIYYGDIFDPRNLSVFPKRFRPFNIDFYNSRKLPINFGYSYKEQIRIIICLPIYAPYVFLFHGFLIEYFRLFLSMLQPG